MDGESRGGVARWLAKSPLRHRDFTLLWLGHFVSQVGSQMQVVAVAWQVYRLTSDPLALGALGLARILPVLVFGIFGGLAADVIDRRKLLLVAQGAMMATSLALFHLTSTGSASLPILYGFCLASGTAVAASNPARQAMIPTLVPEADLARALGFSVSSWQLATVVGPMLGGIVLAESGPALVYLIDGLSFAATIAALLAIRSRGAAAPEARADWSSVLDGFRFLASAPVLLSLMLLDFVGTFFAGAMLLLPIFADQLLEVGPRGLGLLFAAPAIGSTAVALAIAIKGPPPLAGVTVLVSVAAYGLATAAFGATRSFPAAVCFLALAGAADGVSTVVRQTLRQLLTPNEMRGRMTGVSMIFFMGGPQLGELEAGLVGRILGVRASVVLGGLACALSAVLFACFAGGLRRYRLRAARAEPPGAP